MDEFLIDGGFYFNAKSANSIFETLERMLKTLKTFEGLSLQNSKELKKYTWKKNCYKNDNLYKNTLKSHKNA